jgi:pilus assembly protein CpaE
MVEKRFIVVTDNETRFNELSDALKSIGTSVWLHWNTDLLAQLVGSLGTDIVFIDYIGDNAEKAAELTRSLLSVYPRLWVVGFSHRADSPLILEAMRSGARDFIELQSPMDSVRTVKTILEQSPALPAQSAGRMVTVLGARPGIGTTTAAMHLALLLKQEYLADQPVLLLDFGYPSGDAGLYLDTKVAFNFCDAVRSLRRFDQALLNTAFAHHKSGLAIMSLPQNLAELRDITPTDAMTMLSLLKAYFKVVVVDLGGFAGLDLLMYALGISDHVELVCEQSLPSVYSARQLLVNLRERGFDTDRIGLLIGKQDSRIDLGPAQIAQNLQLRLDGNLPQRTDKMIACANIGKPLLEVAPRDPYLDVLRVIAADLCRETGHAAPKGPPQGGSILGRLFKPTTRSGA